MTTPERPLFAAGLALGVGLGGFFDGIAFHQILQLHNMLSAPGYYPKVGVDAETALVHAQINMLWDGLFHALTWATTLAGVALLWRAARRAAAHAGAGGFDARGVGLFNTHPRFQLPAGRYSHRQSVLIRPASRQTRRQASSAARSSAAKSLYTRFDQKCSRK